MPRLHSQCGQLQGALEKSGWWLAQPASACHSEQTHDGMNENIQGAQVVVVNDDSTQLRVLMNLLEKSGHRVFGYPGAEAALAALHAGLRPDLIVSDLYMPGVDGWRFCRLLRSPEHAAFNHTPILVVSATFSGDEAARITTELGANAFLPCPVDGPQFIEQTRLLLQGRVPQAASRVLIVEDSEDLLSLLESAFEGQTYCAETARTGQEALARLEAGEYEVVILDYHLPDVSGDQLLRRCRERRPAAAVIMVTGDPNPQLALEWMKQGASGYVRKPFDLSYLLRLCENAKRERALLRVEDLLEARTRELRENAEVHKIVANFTHDWEYWLTPDGKFRYVSPSCERISGYPPSAFLEDPGLFLRLVHPEDRALVASHLQAAGCGVTHTQQLDFRIQTRLGETRWIGHVCLPVHSETGVFQGVRASNRDITERKQIEAERRDMEQRLLHAQKLESLGVLAGGIAHDFNNLLTAILGNLDLAVYELPPSAGARHSIQQAIQASHRAADLARQMLAYSGRGHFALRPMDLNELVRENAQLFRAAIARTVTLHLELAEDLPRIVADAAQVQQVVMNLITNAAEAIGSHPGVVKIITRLVDADAARLGRSRLAEKPPPGRFFSLAVEDTGCGMDATTLERLFDPFFTTKFTGRGLGMSAVLGIVRGHKGAIFVRSEVGRGTSVEVLFPVPEASLECEALRDVTVGSATPKLEASRFGSILVVDDETPVRNLCLQIVRRLGHRAVGAADGEEALAQLEKQPAGFDCVLLDLTMPRLDGLSTFQEMKRRQADLPIILCSGFGEQDATRQFPSHGLAAFVQKPYRLEDLKDKLEIVLARARRGNSIWSA